MNSFIDKNHTISEIELACFVPMGAGKNYHKNRPSHGIAFNYSGEKNYIFEDGKQLTVKPNDLIYLPKNSTYTVQTIVNGETYCINYQTVDDEIFKPFVLHATTTETLLGAYKDAESAWRVRKNGYQIKCKSILYKIIYEMIKLATTPYVSKTTAEVLLPAIDYIKKNYANELINIENLAKLCGISYEYFRRLFNDCYGRSPIKYINDLKLARAKELMSSGLYTISESAYQSGFSDLSHFSRFFKKETGLSPKEFIKE